MVSIRSAVLATTVAVVAIAPATASAAAVATNNGTQVTFNDTGDVQNAVTISGTPKQVTITDSADTLSAGTGCAATDANTVVCTPAGTTVFQSVSVSVNDAPDGVTQSITNTATGFPDVPAGLFFFGPRTFDFSGQGSLRVTGDSQSESVSARTLSGDLGGGDDTLAYSDGSPSGGAGSDLALIQGDNAGFDGGSGLDTAATFGPFAFDADGAPRSVTLRLDGNGTTVGNGYPDQALTLTGVENGYGGPGDDTLVGAAGPNILYGLSGADTLDGGAGSDLLYGSTGGDFLGSFLSFAGGNQLIPDGASTIKAVDGEADRIDCGNSPAGTTVAADTTDTLIGCPAPGAGTTLTAPPVAAPTQVQVPVQVPVSVPVAVSDTAKATFTAFVAKVRASSKSLRRNGKYSFSFTSNEAGVATSTLYAAPKGLARISKAGDVILATRLSTATAGTAQRVTLTTSRKLRKLLRKGRTMRLELRFVDKGGNVTTATKRIRIR